MRTLTLIVTTSLAASTVSAYADPGEITIKSNVLKKFCETNKKACAKLAALGIPRSAPHVQAQRTRIPEPPPAPVTTASTDNSPSLPTLSGYFFPPSAQNTPQDQLTDCQPVKKALFVRSDSLDNFNYKVSSLDGNSPNAITKGASVTYTDTFGPHTQSAVINGRVSYLLIGGQCGLLSDGKNFVTNFYGFAPFISSNGTWNDPTTAQVTGTTSAGKSITITTKKVSTSALRFGADFEIGLGVPSDNIFQFRQNYLYATPFYQTDYLGQASVVGANLAWEPYAQKLTLNEGFSNPYFSYLTQFRAEVEIIHVGQVGMTQLTQGQHVWIGETARPNLLLFPQYRADTSNPQDTWFNKYIAGRISLIGTQQFYWDTVTGKSAANYSALVQYKLGDCTVDPTKPLGVLCAISGSSAISLEYDWGRNKDTNVKSNQILVKLGYSY